VNARLLPWALFAGFVLAMAVLPALPGKVAVGPAAGTPQDLPAGPEILLATVDVREFHEDSGDWNRLTAEQASYGYAKKTVTGSRVRIHLMEKALRGTTVQAPSASWDFDRAALSFPEGARLDREGGWAAEVSPATLDIAGQMLRVPGPATLSGPGITASGKGLEWEWGEGKITMDSPRGRIQPATVNRRRG
jgi:hypothetical protein